MPRKASKASGSAPATTAQSLGSLLKSARDIMRKDKGLSGDLDRLPMLTWIMFLKFLDDLENQREQEARLAGSKFRAAIEPPYRWRDWAANPEGITGDELLAFINQDEATRPDGTRGPGLFAYLRSLSSANGDDRRDVVATVFKGVDNRMRSGYLLRDVINKVAGIHFTSSDELHTLGALYESMLREMRDAAGDSGEFYTPRPVVRFMVAVTDPRLGETVLDPACGTGGFLVGAYNHLQEQIKTVEDRQILQRRSLFGCEPKPLPYLLGQMNLLLHGLDAPDIDPGNALRFKLSEIGERDRVDVILTNPPFGGEEERGVQDNFPDDKRTSETALLFLQLIMRKLRRRPRDGFPPARAATVASDGFLSTRGVAARVKEQLCSDFNLHTIVRLPRGVFVPYTPIATNLLFFDSGTTSSTWYYEIPGPTDRQMYSKTKPFRYEEFADCLTWWSNRTSGPQAWTVSVDDFIARGFDIDIQNPSATSRRTPPEPLDVFRRLSDSTSVAARLAAEATRLFSPGILSHDSTTRPLPLAQFLKLRKQFITIDDDTAYRLITVQLHARGISFRGEKFGRDIRVKKQQVVRRGDLVVAEIDAKVGGFGIASPAMHGAIVSSHYFLYEIDENLVDPAYLQLWLTSGIPEILIQPHVKGSTNYAAIRQHHFPLLEMITPSPERQREIVSHIHTVATEVNALRAAQDATAVELEALLPSILNGTFRGEL